MMGNDCAKDVLIPMGGEISLHNQGASIKLLS